MLNELKKELNDKINAEYMEYISDIMTYPTSKIIDFAYDITIRNEFVDMLSLDSDYSENTIKFLLSKKNTLEYLYNCWMECDYGLSTMLNENVFDPLYYDIEEYNIKEKSSSKQLKFKHENNERNDR